MERQPSSESPSNADRLLDLLLDALAERQAARRQPPLAPERPAPQRPPDAQTSATTVPSAAQPVAAAPTRAAEEPATRSQAPAVPAARTQAAPQKRKRPPQPGEEGWVPPPAQPSIGMELLLGRFLAVIAGLVLLMNVPVTAYGAGLARVMPDSASLIVRDGLVLKGSGPEVYVLEGNQLRWISSLDALAHLRIGWDRVHVVEDRFLEQFEVGRPIHVLLKCEASPHIYRLEGGGKRWIRDIETFVDEGHVWGDVRMVSCDYLRGLPDGPSIPEGAGPAPSP